MGIDNNIPVDLADCRAKTFTRHWGDLHRQGLSQIDPDGRIRIAVCVDDVEEFPFLDGVPYVYFREDGNGELTLA